MRLNSVLIAGGAALCLAWSAAAVAQPGPDQGRHGHQGGPSGQQNQGGHQGQGQGRHGGRGQGQQGQGQQGQGYGQGGHGQGGQGQHGQGQQGAGPFGQGAFGQGSHGRDHGARGPQGLPQLGDWNRGARGPDRDNAGRDWRGQHRDWDQRSPWRNNRDWWRSNPGFRLFHGPRLGFFFFPGYGYIAVPHEYQNHYWSVGEYLPQWFWRYTVSQYWAYGLPEPPPGCAWIWLDGDVALVDMSDGYIIDMVSNIW